ncbi:hypothetical protein ACFL1H_06875 [Nanoarchaeota archaeon]
MNKRGQIVLYAIILVLIVLAGFLTYKIVSPTDTKQPVKLDVNSVKLFVDSCIESTAEDTLLFIGLKGGYSELPALSTEGLIEIPYYFYEGQNHLLNKTEVEIELNKYMDSQLFFCLINLDLYKEIGFEIKSSSPTTTTSILDTKVIFNVNYPLEISKGDQSQTISEFRTEIPVRLGNIIKFNELIMEEQIKTPDQFCMSCMLNQTIEKDLYMKISRFVNNTYLIGIFDKQSELNGREYLFSYAYKLEEFIE